MFLSDFYDVIIRFVDGLSGTRKSLKGCVSAPTKINRVLIFLSLSKLLHLIVANVLFMFLHPFRAIKMPNGVNERHS